MKARIVIGANFGDEGKGLVTDYLCSHGADVVVRFNGGAQAGHTVVTPENERHVFRHFGSGSFLEVPTFLSQFFVCNPILFFEERQQLIELGFHPEVYAHPDCLVTTFADMFINQYKEDKRGINRHGSCGVGFHETITRSKHVPELKITMSDLWNKSKRLESQLVEICNKYTPFRCDGNKVADECMIDQFIDCCKHFSDCVNPAGLAQFENPVFEGAQGLMLDQDNKEFFPHVTHSHTGLHNVRILCDQCGIKEREIYYVSRTYLTRHGAGPLPGEDTSLSYEDQTNHATQYQGHMRFASMEYSGWDRLKMRCNNDASGEPWKLVLTHCDQRKPGTFAELYATGPTRNDISNKQVDLEHIQDVEVVQ